MWIYLLGSAACFVWGVSQSGWNSLTVFASTQWCIAIFGLVKVWVATEAVRQLVYDRKSGAFELIATTSVNRREILTGHWFALKHHFLWPLIAIFLFLIVTMVWSEIPRWSRWSVSYMIVFPFDLLALILVGLWQGLTAKNINRGIGFTVLFVLGIPWVLGLKFRLAQLFGNFGGMTLFDRLGSPYGNYRIMFTTTAIVWDLILAAIAWRMITRAWPSTSAPESPRPQSESVP